MAECMTFPEYISDFLNEYGFNDSEQVYTNGSELIQVFRVLQALEHYAPELVENLHEKIQCKDCKHYWKEKGWYDKLSIWAEDEHYCAKGKRGE